MLKELISLISIYSGKVSGLTDCIADLTDVTDGMTESTMLVTEQMEIATVDSSSFADNLEILNEELSSYRDVQGEITEGGVSLDVVFGDVGSAIASAASQLAGFLDNVNLLSDDMSSLLYGVSSIGGGIAAIGTGDIFGGILEIAGGLPDLIDGLFESTEEGYVKMFGKWGFDDKYSEDLLSKMSKVSDARGDKMYGIMANLEQFFAETDISNQEEFSRMSEWLSGGIDEMIGQGNTAENAFEKYGDELEQLRKAQEKYGFEMTDSMKQMLTIQRQQTRAGRLATLGEATESLGKIVTGLKKQLGADTGFELSQQSWAGLSSTIYGTYLQMLNQGMSFTEAVEAIKPTLSNYWDIAESQGVNLENLPGYSDLASYFDKIDRFSGALDMINASADFVSVMSEGALIDQSTLDSQVSLWRDVYNQLSQGGFTEDQIMLNMSSWLQSMQEAAQTWNLQLPPEVAQMIEKATEKGILPEEEKSPADVLSDGLVDGFDRVMEKMDKFFNGLNQYAEGGVVPGSKGEKKLVWVHGGEVVGFPSQLEDYMASVQMASVDSIDQVLKAAAERIKEADGMDRALSELNDTLAARGDLGRRYLLEKAQPYLDTNPLTESMPVANGRFGGNREKKMVLEFESSGESAPIRLDNNINLNIDGQDLVRLIKTEMYKQMREDSKRGIIRLHQDAISDY